MRFPLSLVLFVFAASIATAQKTFLLQVHYTGIDSAFVKNHFSIQQKFNDSSSRNAALKKLIDELQDNGYLQASAENIIRNDSSMIVNLNAGQRWYWKELESGNVNEEILQHIHFKQDHFSEKPFQMSEVNQLFNEILKYEENHGYPYASVQLDSVQFFENTVSAKMLLRAGSFVTIDSLGISGNTHLSKQFLENYLNIHLPATYNERAIQNSTSLFKSLSYLQVSHEPHAEIFQNSATAVFFLDKKPANQFDLVIGFLNNSTGKLVVSGQGQLSLANAFGHGENFQLQFSRLSPGSATVDVTGSYPYLFDLPIGLNAAFSLFKNDSLYLNVNAEAGLQFFIRGNDFVKFFYSHFSSSLLTVDTVAIKETHALPPLLDEKQNQFGTGFHTLHFDNFINPSRGYALDVKGTAGERKILKNPTITRLVDVSDTFHFESLYDTFPSHQWQASLEIHFSSYIPINKSLTGKIAFDDATLFSKDILINEWYHIGGFHLLRGFDEWSIPASHYDVLSVELHYLLTPNAYAMIFSDNAYVQQRSVDERENDFPVGFGAGFQLQTKAGIFSIAMALGKNKQQELALKNAKIHVGYVNYF